MTAERIVVIGRRFRGPPDSGNGGYVCGLLSGAAATPLQVRLQVPPPLDKPLQLREDPAQDRILLLDKDQVIAAGVPGAPDLEVPEAPGYAEALEAARGFTGFQHHPFPGCFVCGTERARGDGLRIFAAPVEGRDLYVAPWLPDESLAGPDGKIRPEFIWAALDCPGFFATVAAERSALLGQFTARIDRRVHVNESCVLIGWAAGSEGRKHSAGTALFDGNGEVCARASAIWIAPKA